MGFIWNIERAEGRCPARGGRFSGEDRTSKKKYELEPLYEPGTATDPCHEFPNPKLLRPMERTMCNNLGPFTYLLEYGGIRYLFLLTYNGEIEDCEENRLLEEIHEGVEIGDEDHLEKLTEKCLELFWPFLKADYGAQKGKSTYANVSVDWKKKMSRNIRVKTIDGVLQRVDHYYQIHPQEVVAIENRFPRLKIFLKNQIDELEALWSRGNIKAVFKVRIQGHEYCLKKLPVGTLDIGYERQISRECKLLQKIPRHSNLSELVGVRDAGDGKIDGLILRHIHGKPLSKVQKATALQKNKWKRQILETIRLLHEEDIVWGDAKPDNILVEEKSDNVVLIDFGGGVSVNWVDDELAETREGDLQGLSRILDFIDNL